MCWHSPSVVTQLLCDVGKEPIVVEVYRKKQFGWERDFRIKDLPSALYPGFKVHICVNIWVIQCPVIYNSSVLFYLLFMQMEG